MHLIESIKRFVVASQQSLEILQKLQAVEDADFEKFKAENPDADFGTPDIEENRRAKLN